MKIGSIKLICCTSTTHFQLWFLSGWPLNVPVVCLEDSMYTLLQEYEVLFISADELVTQSLYRSFQLSQFNTRNAASHINSHCTRIPAYLDDVRSVSWWRQTRKLRFETVMSTTCFALSCWCCAPCWQVSVPCWPAVLGRCWEYPPEQTVCPLPVKGTK